jgi:hypothetical protein
MTKELLYPDGKLIARGRIRLVPDGGESKAFPFGLTDAQTLDPALGEDESTMFLLAVGREGPPLAAKRVKAKDLQFPYVFELTSDDLLFPYTPDAWTQSPNSKDTIALTAVLSPDGLLSTGSASERVGFGLSEPAQVAGKFSRETANIAINSKLNTNLYTTEEVEILKDIDSGLNRGNAGAPGSAKVRVQKSTLLRNFQQ